MVTRRQKPKQTRLPRGQGKVRRSRVRTRGDGHKLCEWVQRREKLQEAPSFNTALAGKYISLSNDARPDRL